MKRAINLVKLFEPALATLVSPSRIRQFDSHRMEYALDTPNQYCRPVASVYSLQSLARVQTFADLWQLSELPDARYVSFNIARLKELHTVEVRLHNGTTNAKKVLLWVSLWKQILWAAAELKDVPLVEDVELIEPSGDIIKLAKKYLPFMPALFLHKLEDRRRTIIDSWAKYPELDGWLKYQPRWVPVD